jgi:three-Cys-motif partner protein
MPSSSEFFEQRSPQAVLKHGVLTRYAYYFAGRAGRATHGRVAFIDGYAGEGRYQDGNPGSPLLLASEANRAGMLGRDVKLAFVEQDDARRGRLRQSLDEHGIVPDQVVGGSLEDVIDDLLNRYAGRAVLLFVDPFGLAVDRSTLEGIIRRSPRTQPIDVLYHFSLLAVARMGRAGVVDGPTLDQNSRRLDAALGPVGWREIFEVAEGPQRPTLAAIDVANRFGESIRRATGRQSTAIAVRQRPDQLPKYLLTLFSGDERAHWDFADVASEAYVDWLHHCDTEDYQANVRLNESRGVLSLFEDAPPRREDVERDLRSVAEDYLVDNIGDLLRTRGSIRPVTAVVDVYGDMLGRARATHVRAAIKALHASGRTDDNGIGDFWMRTTTWTGT